MKYTIIILIYILTSYKIEAQDSLFIYIPSSDCVASTSILNTVHNNITDNQYHCKIVTDYKSVRNGITKLYGKKFNLKIDKNLVNKKTINGESYFEVKRDTEILYRDRLSKYLSYSKKNQEVNYYIHDTLYESGDYNVSYQNEDFLIYNKRLKELVISRYQLKLDQYNTETINIKLDSNFYQKTISVNGSIAGVESFEKAQRKCSKFKIPLFTINSIFINRNSIYAFAQVFHFVPNNVGKHDYKGSTYLVKIDETDQRGKLTLIDQINLKKGKWGKHALNTFTPPISINQDQNMYFSMYRLYTGTVIDKKLENSLLGNIISINDSINYGVDISLSKFENEYTLKEQADRRLELYGNNTVYVSMKDEPIIINKLRQEVIDITNSKIMSLIDYLRSINIAAKPISEYIVIDINYFNNELRLLLINKSKPELMVRVINTISNKLSEKILTQNATQSNYSWLTNHKALQLFKNDKQNQFVIRSFDIN